MTVAGRQLGYLKKRGTHDFFLTGYHKEAFQLSCLNQGNCQIRLEQNYVP